MFLRLRTFLAKYFYFAMSLLITAVVIYGFSHTVNKNLIHPEHPRPHILWLHAIIFTSWLVFFIVQSGLVRIHQVRIHKLLGYFGVIFGAAIIVVGLSTAFTIHSYHLRVDHRPLVEVATNFAIPCLDMVCFTCTFIPAILYRKQPEFHRRLILMASCALTAAGWGRIPVMGYYFWLGVDFLILLGVFRDLIVMRRVHKVYAWGLPAFFIAQGTAFALFTLHPAFFLSIVNFLLS